MKRSMTRHLLTCPVPSSNEPTQQPSIEEATIEESKDDFSAKVEILTDSDEDDDDDDHGDNCGVSDPL